MLERCLEMYRQGHIHPIRPVKIFEASEIEESFRHLQAGNHIGKVVIQMPEDASKIASSPRARVLALDPEAAYLLVGGLGGLGKSIAIWMVEREARFLVFLSRNAGLSDEDKAFLKELESMGCSVSAIAGEVQAMEDVQRTISKASRPIKGVIQLAMVLRVSYLGFLLSNKGLLIDCEGCAYRRHEPCRLDGSNCAKSGRYLESTQRLLSPFARFLSLGQFPRHSRGPTGSGQLQCSKHLP